MRWETKMPNIPFGTTIWKGICKRKELFIKRIRFNVKKGNTVKFWEDRWLFEEPIATVCPNLFNAVRSHNFLVADMGRIENNIMVWNLNFSRRIIRTVEIEEFAVLMNALDNFEFDRTSEDEVMWMASKSKEFTVASCYGSLTQQFQQNFRADLVWKQEWPPKIAFFLWLAIHNRILTLDNMERRGYMFVNRCFMCRKELESVSHLLLYCDFSYALWSYFWGELNVAVIIPGSLQALFEGWSHLWTNTKGKEVWILLPAAITWSLWVERNKRVFEDQEVSLDRMIIEVKALIFFWLSAADPKKFDRISFQHLVVDWKKTFFDPP
ncbi:Reverse transcriptase zinc-binding domain [Macleaya cordata]|uniref:Reverse transcriptase zinc-binding domain n=1 Tax=Macleaya cordata TaxID=56857 RepID=A0A200PPB5_MACCD|nr:Reverse transcriptase zinc-binding domain [Macleaya cordata]